MDLDRSRLVVCGCVLAMLFVAGCTTLSELRNPTVTIPVDHPPGIGVRLTKVTLAPPSGSCSAQVANTATRELLARGVEVGSDVTLVATVSEAAAEAVRTGTAPGGSILLTLSDTACGGERSSSLRHETRKRKKTRQVDGKKQRYEEKYTVTRYTRTTRFDAGVSVRASDPRTNEVVAAWEMRHEAKDSKTAVDDVPDYPSESALRRSALNQAGAELVRWLLPWTEEVNLLFYDADECGMATTYARFLAGDPDSAAAAARRSIEACESGSVDARFRAAAYHNAGMVHFSNGRYAAALEMFDAAAALDPENEHVRRAAGEVKRARRLLEEIRRIEAPGSPAAHPG